MLLHQRKLLSEVTGHVSIDSSSCQSRTQILLEMFPLHRVPLSRTLATEGEEGWGREVEKEKEGAEQCLLLTGKCQTLQSTV